MSRVEKGRFARTVLYRECKDGRIVRLSKSMRGSEVLYHLVTCRHPHTKPQFFKFEEGHDRGEAKAKHCFAELIRQNVADINGILVPVRRTEWGSIKILQQGESFIVRVVQRVNGKAKTESKRFATKHEAVEYYEHVLKNGPQKYKKVREYLPLAESIKAELTKKCEPTLGLLLALNYVFSASTRKQLSASSSNQELEFREGVAKILYQQTTLPRASDLRNWASNCMNLLGTVNLAEPGKPVKKTTVQRRGGLFIAALRFITVYPEIFGRTLADEVELAIIKAKSIQRSKISEALPMESNVCHSVRKIRALLVECVPKDGGKTLVPSANQSERIEQLFQLGLPRKIYLLKAFASGLRPSEVKRLSKSHMGNNLIDLSKVVSKTPTNSLAKTSLCLRVILNLPEILTSLRHRDFKFFKRQLDSTEYSFRTTFCSHQYYCGMPITEAQTRVGHETPEMLMKHYLKPPPESVPNPFVYYDLKPEMIVDGHVVAKHDTPYDRFLLKTLLDELRTALSNDEFKEVKHLVTKLDGVTVDVPTGSESY